MQKDVAKNKMRDTPQFEVFNGPKHGGFIAFHFSFGVKFKHVNGKPDTVGLRLQQRNGSAVHGRAAVSAIKNPSILVENIFLNYYFTYDNYTFYFMQLSKFLRTRKMKQILRLASDDCIYSNKIYEEYIRYCIQEHIEPVFQFGTLSYTSKEMFDKAPLENNYPHFELGISYQEIKKLYEELKRRKWIDQFTSFNLFVFYFSGKCKPDNLSFVLWTAPINELAYLLTRLYKDKLSTTVPFKIAKQIFIIEGAQSIEDLNLSAIASGLGKKRKQVVDELYDIIFCVKKDI